MTWARNAEVLLRAEWLAVMDDACTINTNAQGQGTYSTVTKTYDGTPSQVYSGQCLVREAGHSSVDYAEGTREVVDYDVYVPGDTAGLAPDQQITINTINSAQVPTDLQGKTMTVREIGLDTYNARIRLGCQLDRGTG